ncbi:MAG TPA: DUF4239 domain-containing protein [Mycobacteriales bacterium]|nr:DUF4239 domain-containing protein [Mycobacteriales bacterium]
MIIWLLNHFAVWSLTAGTVGGSAILAVLGCLAIRRRFPGVAEGEHNELVGVLLGVFAAIYGVLLAFVIFILWDDRVQAQDTVSAEATALSQIVFDARALPNPERATIVSSVDSYVHVVSGDEWNALRENRGPDPRATAALDRLRASIAGYTPRNDAESAFYGDAVTDLSQAATNRRDRLSVAESVGGNVGGNGPLTLLELLLVGGAVVFVPLTYLFGHRSRLAHSLFVAISTALVALGLLLTVVLGQPFAGDLAVSPSPFHSGALAQFWTGGDSGH